MKIGVFIILMALFPAVMAAQESTTAYNLLRLPVSAHAAALGGENITLADDDATQVFQNPALANFVSDMTLNLNYMTYMNGVKTASASFVRALGERASWGVTAQYMDYGTMRQTTADNEQTGDFSARDICIGGTLAYGLTGLLSGGISAKVISSHIAGYHALAVGIDLGLNYCSEEEDLSLSATVKNLGGQVKAYDEEFEKMPLDLQAGISYKLSNAPLRFSLTLSRLNDWSEAFARHIALGADVLLSDRIYLAAGYSLRRAQQMKIDDGGGSSSHGAGLTLGAGLSLERLKIHVGYGKYHVSASSLIFNISYVL